MRFKRGVIVAMACTLIMLLTAPVPRLRSPFADRDIMSDAVSAAEFRRHIASIRFLEPGPMTPLHSLDSVERTRASGAPVGFGSADSTTMSAGMVLARIESTRSFEAWGLTEGSNYLWVDRRGSGENPWRAVMIGADGHH